MCNPLLHEARRCSSSSLRSSSTWSVYFGYKASKVKGWPLLKGSPKHCVVFAPVAHTSLVIGCVTKNISRYTARSYPVWSVGVLSHRCLPLAFCRTAACSSTPGLTQNFLVLWGVREVAEDSTMLPRLNTSHGNRLSASLARQARISGNACRSRQTVHCS